MDRLTMFMTGQESIQEVLLFPQMRPEKVVKKDPVSKYDVLGIDSDLVAVIQKAGYPTLEDLKNAKAQKIRQDLGDVNKKYKLELSLPSVEQIEQWLAKLI